MSHRSGHRTLIGRKAASVVAGSVTACLILGGCGTVLPDYGEVYDTTPPETLIDAIVEYVHCEVKSQVAFLLLDDRDRISAFPDLNLKRQLSWLDDWGAQVTLGLTVDEKSTLSPGLSINKILPNAVTVFPGGNITTGQSASTTLGASISSDASRKATVSWFIDFREFSKSKRKLAEARAARDLAYAQAAAAGIPNPPSPCARKGGVLIEGDLKFREWLYMMLKPTFVTGGVTGNFADALKAEAKIAKKDVLQDQITFIVTYSGNVTPTWKLVKVTGNPSGPFYSANRSRTQDLTITLGQAPDDSKANSATAAQNQALATAIGIAVGKAIRENQP